MTRIPFLEGWRGLALLIAFAAASLWHVHVMDPFTNANSDLVAPYVGARAALARKDPYSDAVTQKIQKIFFGRVLAPREKEDRQAFVYPIFTAFLLAPFVWLPLTAAKVAYTMAAIGAIALSVPAWLKVFGLSPANHSMRRLSGLALVSWPSVVALRQQQLSVLAFGLLSLSCFLLCRKKDVAAGAMLGAAIFKPQLALPCIFWLLLWGWSNRRPKFCAAAIATPLVLFVSGYFLLPDWPMRWLLAVRRFRGYTNGDLSLRHSFGAIGVLLLLAICAASILLLYESRRSAAPSLRFGISVSLCLSVAICLYPTNIYWIYNQILLIPGCLLLLIPSDGRPIISIPRTIAKALFVWPFLLLPAAILLEACVGPGIGTNLLPFMNPLLPAGVCIYLVALLAHDHTGSLKRPKDLQPCIERSCR